MVCVHGGRAAGVDGGRKLGLRVFAWDPLSFCGFFFYNNAMLKMVLVLALVVLVIVSIVRLIESRSVFFPMKELTVTPMDFGIPFREIRFPSKDGVRLSAWWIPLNGAKKTLLFCHGNAGNIGHRLEKIRILREAGSNVFIFDYRGYGLSEGRPSEKGFYRDVDAAYGYLTKELGIPARSIVAYGESIGGAVAIDLARRLPVGALAVECTFTNVADVVHTAIPFLPSWMLASRFDSASKIGRIHCPLLVMGSVDDEIVPFQFSQTLFKRASEPKRFVGLRGGHNTAYLESGSDYRDGIRSFLESVGQA